MTIKSSNKDYASFRDPSGFVYQENGKIFRMINECYIDEYDNFMSSGLYEELVSKELIVRHKEVKRTKKNIVLEVEVIPFVTYPYEWCFEQLRDAALLTLEINRIALSYDMVLKDASAYNVQFLNGRAIFIDTLSFQSYEEGMPWGAYGQFSKHFISPLLLMNNIDERMNAMLKEYIDGIPLDLTDSILKNRGGFFAKQHIHWQNKSIQKHNADGKRQETFNIKISKQSLLNINTMLQNQIMSLKRKKVVTEWDDYYDNTNYSKDADFIKQDIVENFVKRISSSSGIAIDMGANDGKYSRIISKYFDTVISTDIDYNAICRSYLYAKEKRENILPLVFDFNNPSPSIGFSCKERKGFKERTNAKLVMALALIHHIAISNNVPFDKIAEWFSEMSKYLIVEFVPKSDSQVKLLLKTRNDIFDSYTQECFEENFSKYFKIVEQKKIKENDRVLYLMEKI